MGHTQWGTGALGRWTYPAHESSVSLWLTAPGRIGAKISLRKGALTENFQIEIDRLFHQTAPAADITHPPNFCLIAAN